ncbi:MAG: cellulose biosynthesis cyclic di-GMP-binding regulatory protein BcsB [Aquificaceae bacterium]|nr:cellulose biosynthesis cyclic di-GMP-binding regulatory protein BcsB [Aquificaceae bacterium]
MLTLLSCLLLGLSLLWATEGLLIRETPKQSLEVKPPKAKPQGAPQRARPSVQEGSLPKQKPPPLTLQASRVSSYTFKELNFLGDDLVLRGTAPAYDFYIPVYAHLEGLKLSLKISTPEYLREDSTVLLLVDDVPHQSFKIAGGQGRELLLTLKPRGNQPFIKVSLRGSLRASNNLCEDAFSDRIYMVISKDSSVEFYYRPPLQIEQFIRDYDLYFCLQDVRLIPLAYVLLSQSSLPAFFSWGEREDCKNIKVAQQTYLQGSTLFLSENTLKAVLEGYTPLIFGRAVFPDKVSREKSQSSSQVSLREFGIGNKTVRGMSNLSVYIPLDLAKIGGMPDTLHFRLKFEHTPPHQKDKMELRVYLNDDLIRSLPLEGAGRKEVDIKIPTHYLTYGVNGLLVNLVNFTSSDNCFGAVAQSVLTVYEDSYFYWNSLMVKPHNIADFLRIMNGKLTIVLKEQSLYPFALKFINELAFINRNVEEIRVLTAEPEADRGDFMIVFEKPQQGLFQVYNPLTQEVLFSARYELPFIAMVLGEKKGTPVLTVSAYGTADPQTIGKKYSSQDYLRLLGNVAILSEEYATAFEVGKKLRIRHEGERGMSYYWNLVRPWAVLLLGLLGLTFLIYVYRKLTRRPS